MSGGSAPNEVSDVTRRAVFDLITWNEFTMVSWSGRLNDVDFLGRIYDLAAMPSDDFRFSNAAQDIQQHRINNSDWPDGWVFTDHRFNLLYASDAVFFRFLCETLHPFVRPNASDVSELLNAYNEELRIDAWELAPFNRISGRPVFAAKKLDGRMVLFDEPTGWEKVDRQVREIRERLDAARTEEQYQAVGLLCRVALLSVAQKVYSPERHIPTDGKRSSTTDVKRMLDAIFEAELRGGANEEARAYAKAAARLSDALTHKDTADFQMAALCAEGTLSVVNLLAVLAGQRGARLVR